MPTSISTLAGLHSTVTRCQRCPRLREYCEKVAKEKRRAFLDWDYWGKPVSGFGDPRAKIWIVGLAPAAHGANRTGRVFTGDRSGDFLYAALYRARLANQPVATSRDDGLKLTSVYISTTVRCAPPGNKPLPSEIAHCSEYLDREWSLLSDARVLLALGKIAWDACLALACRQKCEIPTGSKSFAHGAQLPLSDTRTLVGSYHVSQQNTFTGKLTPAMFDAVISQCLRIAKQGRS